MKLPEIMMLFQQMPASDRLYILCRILQDAITYELNFISMFLHGVLKERLSGVSELEGNPNTVAHYSTFDCNSLSSKKHLEKISACLSLIRYDNKQVGGVVFKLLDQRSVLTLAEETDDLSLLENLRLVYIMAVYHPSLSFQERSHLLNVFLHHLDEIYDSKIAEEETRKREEMEAAIERNRPTRPGDDALIVLCELKGFYKRQSDKRYTYVIEVHWSDGARCCVQRTYGDFFGFQNKLLDLFPEESGQKNKKARVIPFLPGRRLLSGKSNRELAEKRLPDLWKYTYDLFQLPERISSCKHVRDFFRPYLSDSKDENVLQRITTLNDIKDSSKNRHPSAPAGGMTSSSPAGSPSKSRAGFLSSLGGGRNASTLPPEASPGRQKDMSNITRRSTFPARPNQSAFTPIASTTPTSSSEKLNSSSQTSLGSTDKCLATPTTTACRVVTPTTTRANGSPAFSVSHTSQLASSSWTNMSSVPQTEPSGSTVSFVKSAKQVKRGSPSIPIKGGSVSKDATIPKSVTSGTDGGSVDPLSSTTSSPLLSISSTSIAANGTSAVSVAIANTTTSSWAECSSPTNIDTSFLFTAHTSNQTPSTCTPTVTSTSSAVFIPIQSTPTTKDQVARFSPSLTPVYQYGGGGSQPTYSNYPFSYTPTNFDSPSPKHAGMGGRWQSSYTPLCHTPVPPTPTEADQCRKWLKLHRLHKYEHLFQNMTFDEISSLSVDQLKEMNMTQGAAKKMQQKMEELKQNNIHCFRDIPLSSLTRKPSTSSLPAALLLQERQMLTPSSSIDQLSLHGSSCSLDILGHHLGNVSQSHSDGINMDMIISKIDGAIVEAGPINEGLRQYHNHSSSDLDRGIPRPIVRSMSSQGNSNNCNVNGLHTPSRSVDSTPSHSPLKVQRSLSPHHTSHFQATPHSHSYPHSHSRTQSETSSGDSRRTPDSTKSANRSSLPNPPISQPHFSTPQFHRKDVRSLPVSVGDGQDTSGHHHHPPRIPHGLVPTVNPTRVHNWSHSPVVHSGPIVVPNSVPILRGRFPSPILPQGYPQAAINGIMQAPPPLGLTHLGLQRMPSYPVTPRSTGGVTLPTTPPSFTCYNCGKPGHQGHSCANTSSSPVGDFHFGLNPNSLPLTPPSSASSSKGTKK